MPEEPEDFDVWPEHHEVVALFVRASRQWRVAGETVLGLDLVPVFAIAKLMAIEPTLELLDDLQIMEARAVELLNKPAKKKGRKR